MFIKQKFAGGLVLDVLSVFSSLGGIFTVISGAFAVIFGRDLLIIITGGWSLSPVGLLGLFSFMREDFRNAINKHFPNLKDEISGGGMAQFLTEVAIDINLIDQNSGQANRSGMSPTRSPSALSRPTSPPPFFR